MTDSAYFNSDAGGPGDKSLTGIFVIKKDSGDSVGGMMKPGDTPTGLITNLPGYGFGEIKSLGKSAK